MKKSKLKLYVSFAYPLDVYFNIDSYVIESKLEKLAKKFNGIATGSGAGFDQRDLSFEFDTILDAQKYYKQARSFIPKLKYDYISIICNYQSIDSIEDLKSALEIS